MTTPASLRPGVVRVARRPMGWSPGGPAPRGSQGHPRLVPGPGEDLCFLAGDFRVFQRQDGHRWSLDDLVTAHLAARLAPEDPETFLDLGCGIGSVLMMLAWRFPGARGVGIEAQDISADLARRSLRYNGIDDRIAYHHGDFRDSTAIIGDARFDLITGTPPYFNDAEATVSAKPQCGPCRFEWRGGVEDYLRVAARHLHEHGLFVMVAATAQTARVDAASAPLALHKTFEWAVVPKLGKPPLIVVHAFERSGQSIAGCATARDTLIVRDANNQWTDTFRQVRQDLGMPSHRP